MRAITVLSVLRDLPFFDHQTTVAGPNGEVIVRPFQIVVCFSVTPQHVVDPEPGTPRFPAILDTGNNHNFSMRQKHLEEWTGTTSASFFERGRISIAGEHVPLVSANVWLHRNQVGERDKFSKRLPVCLELPEGIAVYPPSAPRTVRLPTLGLRALVRNNLKVIIVGGELRLSVQQGRRRS